MTKNDQNDPQKDTLGTQIGPRKVIFSHFFYFVHFPIEIPIVVEKKTTTMGRKGPRAKTKIVLKSVKQWEQLGNMHNWSFRNF